MGWSRFMAGFERGVHEFLAQTPPISLCAGIASMDHREGLPKARDSTGLSGGLIVWIGRRCWPYPPALVSPGVGTAGDAGLLERSVYVDPPTREDRLWAMDVALRSPAAAVVVADARGLSMAGSRRLQLAAEAGGAVGLLARRPDERGEISAAATRWLVSPGPPEGADPARPTWTLRLLRRKGLRPMTEDARDWTVRLDDATRLVSVDADAADRPAAAARPGRWAHAAGSG
ncbi:MAG: hypothetical protein RIE32_02815 [Phycisphaerales bacterium]